MTDPTPTRAEVEAIDRAIERLRALHDYAGRPAWDQVVREELGASFQVLRERTEAAEAERKAADFRLVDRYRNPKTGIFNFPDDVAAIVRALDEARRAEAAAWNDAIEAAASVYLNGANPNTWDYFSLARHEIRALRRAAPTEGEA